MRSCLIAAGLIALQIISSGCGQTRQIDPAIAQTGPLIGTWEYVGDDLVDVDAGVVRNFVIGDGTWYIPKTLTFKADGTSANIGYHDCHFWTLDDRRLKLSVGNGNRIYKYQIKDGTLTLSLSPTREDGSPVLRFIRSTNA